MITVYGISNCDSVKKARKWLEQYALEYRFHDFRKDGLEQATIEAWLANDGVELATLLNKRSTTWKQLDPEAQQSAEGDAAALMAEHPTLIKRPVLIQGDTILVGFKEAAYQQLLSEESQ